MRKKILTTTIQTSKIAIIITAAGSSTRMGGGTKKEFLPKLEVMKNYGIKGLECFYSRYSEQEEEFLLNCAKENNLLISGGSDYHGTNKKNIFLAKLNTDNNPVDINSITLLNCLNLKL